MKKIISFTLALFLLFSLCACNEKSDDENKTYGKSTWDGSVASAFKSGDGSKEQPYKITNAAEFAYLSESVNKGNPYTEKYISLACDLDLNHLDWTPIGNGNTKFEGFFDGNNHLIENLKITKGHHFEEFLPAPNVTIKHFSIGLFGVCNNATIKNLNIQNVEVMPLNKTDEENIEIGILCGYLTSSKASDFLNIKISNSKIEFDWKETLSRYLNVGSILGRFYSESKDNFSFKQLQADTVISFSKTNTVRGYFGGLFGSFYSAFGTGIIENCNSSVAIELDNRNFDRRYLQDLFLGAIGILQISEPTTIKNIFSKTAINRWDKNIPLMYDAEFLQSSIIGDIGVSDRHLTVENAFGYNTDSRSDEFYRYHPYRLFSTMLIGPEFTGTNCKGCEVLPENHGFDPEIWDLSDLANPKLK